MDIIISQAQTMLEFRQTQKWSQERLARELGVSAKSVYRWEKGVSKPSPRILKRFEHLKFSRIPLTAREIEVLRLMVQGVNNKYIASSLFISENTVKTHVRNILKNFNFKHKRDAISHAIREGMVD